MSELATISEQKSQIQIADNGLKLTTMDELWRFSKAVVVSGLAPKGMDKVESAFIAIEMGMELGLPPMTSIQNIASVNGRPAIWGDAQLALVRKSGLLRSMSVEEVGTFPKDDYGWKITVERVGDKSTYTEVYTVADAKVAGLWGKSGPWTTNPKRMLKYRARSFVLRDVFPDVLKGMLSREEAFDIDVEVVDSKPKKQKLFTAKKEFAEEEPEDAFTPPNPPIDEAPQVEAPQAPKDIFEELNLKLEAEGLTQAQCMGYARKNGLLSAGKMDEFAVQKILNAWDAVKEFIANEKGTDNEF